MNNENEKYIEVKIDTEEIADYLHAELMNEGVILHQEELDMISNIIFDFLIEKIGLIDITEDDEG